MLYENLLTIFLYEIYFTEYVILNFIQRLYTIHRTCYMILYLLLTLNEMLSYIDAIWNLIYLKC